MPKVYNLGPWPTNQLLAALLLVRRSEISSGQLREDMWSACRDQCNFLDQYYHYKSVATHVPHDTVLAPTFHAGDWTQDCSVWGSDSTSAPQWQTYSTYCRLFYMSDRIFSGLECWPTIYLIMTNWMKVNEIRKRCVTKLRSISEFMYKMCCQNKAAKPKFQFHQL